MSEHLKFARAYLMAAENWLMQVKKQDTTFYERQMFATMAEVLSHLEAQQETPASEPSSAPTTGPAERRWEWRSVTPDVPTASLEEAQGSFRLTVETTDCSKSMQFTPAELEAISWLFLTLPPTSELHTTSGSTKAGNRGVAVPDSPASSPEPAQGGSEGCKYQWWHKGDFYTCNYPVVQDDRCRLHLRKEAAPYSSVRPALTNHEGRE